MMRLLTAPEKLPVEHLWFTLDGKSFHIVRIAGKVVRIEEATCPYVQMALAEVPR